MTRLIILVFLWAQFIALSAADEAAIFDALRSGQPWVTDAVSTEAEQWHYSISGLFELKFSTRGAAEQALVNRMIPVLRDYLKRPEVSPLVIVDIIDLFNKQDTSDPAACDFIIECFDRLSHRPCEDHLLPGRTTGTLVTDAHIVESAMRIIISMGIRSERVLAIADALSAQNRLDPAALSMLVRGFPNSSSAAIDHAVEAIVVKNPTTWSPDEYNIMRRAHPSSATAVKIAHAAIDALTVHDGYSRSSLTLPLMILEQPWAFQGSIDENRMSMLSAVAKVGGVRGAVARWLMLESADPTSISRHLADPDIAYPIDALGDASTTLESIKACPAEDLMIRSLPLGWVNITPTSPLSPRDLFQRLTAAKPLLCRSLLIEKAVACSCLWRHAVDALPVIEKLTWIGSDPDHAVIPPENSYAHAFIIPVLEGQAYQPPADWLQGKPIGVQAGLIRCYPKWDKIPKVIHTVLEQGNPFEKRYLIQSLSLIQSISIAVEDQHSLIQLFPTASDHRHWQDRDVPMCCRVMAMDCGEEADAVTLLAQVCKKDLDALIWNNAFSLLLELDPGNAIIDDACRAWQASQLPERDFFEASLFRVDSVQIWNVESASEEV